MEFSVGFLLFLWFIAKSQSHTFILEKGYNCDNDTVRNIWNIHYNFSVYTTNGYGYFEFLRNIRWEDHIQIAIDLYHKTNGQWVKNKSETNKNVCVFLFADMLLVPVVQKFANFEGRCPVKKGQIAIHDGKVVSKYHPLLPYGCWKVVVHIGNPETTSVEGVCLIIRSAESLKTNLQTCD